MISSLADAATRTTARIAAFSPGQSPPPVNTPIRTAPPSESPLHRTIADARRARQGRRSRTPSQLAPRHLLLLVMLASRASRVRGRAISTTSRKPGPGATALLLPVMRGPAVGLAGSNGNKVARGVRADFPRGKAHTA